MATRTARRGLGARVILAAIAVSTIAAITVPASAHPNELVDTSVESGWATVTKMEEFPPGGRAFDPTDPPYQRADGPVEFVVARWARTICSGSIVVTDKGGLPVAGVYTQEYYGLFPDRVQKLTFAIPLKASGAPYTATFTAGHLEADGTCTLPVAVAQTFGLDRFIAEVPSVTSPAAIFGPNGNVCPRQLRSVDNAASTTTYDDCTANTLTTDPVGVVIPQQPGEPVIVKGTAVDPLTYPDEDRTETSGISRVIIRLYQLDTFNLPFCTFPINSGACSAPIKTYEVPNDCSGVISDGSSSTGLPACNQSLGFEVDITPDLEVGNEYSIDVFALDKAGDTGNELTAQRRSGETKSRTFVYLG